MAKKRNRNVNHDQSFGAGFNDAQFEANRDLDTARKSHHDAASDANRAQIAHDRIISKRKEEK